MQVLGRRLLAWYATAKRALPWRETTDPYTIWLSEVILQQTRVAQGEAYFLRFWGRYPTVAALAQAPLDDVLKQWEGLGYYTRARNLHRAAQTIMTQHGGQFPPTVEGLEALPGIGPYTARAIASLAFGVQVAVVDGNVYRVLSRLWADGTPIDAPRARLHYQSLADTLLAEHPAATFNQALMELGALVCTPRAPKCTHCPWHADCAALAAEAVLDYPRKAKRATRPLRAATVLVVWRGQHVAVRQRPPEAKGVWRGLYELPTIEHPHPTPSVRPVLFSLVHEFTHYRLALSFVQASEADLADCDGVQWVTLAEAERLAFGRPYRKYLDGLNASQRGLFD